MTLYSPLVGSRDDEKPGVPEGQGHDRQAGAERFPTVRAISSCRAASHFQAPPQSACKPMGQVGFKAL
jgi:hypothetical protein